MSSSEDAEDERNAVENYVKQYDIQSVLNNAVNRVVRDRPEDPFLILGDLIKSESSAGKGILHIDAEQVIDGLSLPGIKVILTTEKGVFEAFVSSCVPGVYDTLTKEEQEEEKQLPFQGKGIRNIVSKIHDILQHKLEGMDPDNQDEIDRILEGMQEKLGKNVTLAVSMAVCKAAAKQQDIELYERIANLGDVPNEHTCIPIPLCSVVNGGMYASNKLYIQEVFLSCPNATSFEEALHYMLEVNHSLMTDLESKGFGNSSLGTYGGFATQLSTVEENFQIIKDSIDKTNDKLKNRTLELHIGVDVGACEFHVPNPSGDTDGAHEYNLDKWVENSKGMKKTSDELITTYSEWKREYKVTSFVDPFHEHDLKSFRTFNSNENDIEASEEENVMQKLGGDEKCFVQVVGYNLVKKGLSYVHDECACNTVLLDIGQFGTISETVKNATDAKSLGFSVIVGSQHGNAMDTFIADFAVGIGAGQVKIGGLRSHDSLHVYNYLLKISKGPFAPPYAGSDFRK